MRLWALLLIAGVAAGDVETIYVVPGSHQDIGFTDVPSRVLEKRLATLEDAIDAAEKDPAFHWSEEGAWVADAWLDRHAKDDGRRALLRRLLAAGQISIGATWADAHSALFRSSLDLLCTHLERLDRELGYKPRVAVMNDVPSQPEALVDALAAHGVKYLLVGANMAFTAPLPHDLERRPFWWESAAGKWLLVFIDPDSYVAAYMKWGIDPDCARFFDPKAFPPDKGPMETMEAGISRMLRVVDPSFDAVVVQHAFDNWDDGAARKLPGFLQQWNGAGKKPRIVLAPPEEYFRHIEEKYGAKLAVRHGDWGGDWEPVRASCPVWTWRIRHAAEALKPDSPYEARAAMSTVMDHSFGLGGGWPGMFTEKQTLDNAREVSGLMEKAVTLARGAEAAQALPAQPVLPDSGSLPKRWIDLLAVPDAPIRVRAGKSWLWSFVAGNAPALATPVDWGADGGRFVAVFTVDQKRLSEQADPDVAVVVEVALRAEASALRLAPEGDRSALEGHWLRGTPPPYVVAPEGLVVLGLPERLTVRSPIVFAWQLAADEKAQHVTWLRGLVLHQSTACELKGGAKKAFPFEALYPGEPAELPVSLELGLPDAAKAK